MIRLRYPNITPCEMMFYRTFSARHYHTSLQHPCPLYLSGSTHWCELQSALVLCLGLQMLPSWCSSAAISRPLCPPNPGLPTPSSVPTPQVCPAGLSGSTSLWNTHRIAMLGQYRANTVMLLSELDWHSPPNNGWGGLCGTGCGNTCLSWCLLCLPLWLIDLVMWLILGLFFKSVVIVGIFLKATALGDMLLHENPTYCYFLFKGCF